MDGTSMLVSVTFVAVSSPVALAGVRAYRLYGSARQVTCPETVEEVLVKVQVTRAVASAITGGNQVSLKSCSRWPEKKNCNQACVNQLRGVCSPRALPTASRRARPLASVGSGFIEM